VRSLDLVVSHQHRRRRFPRRETLRTVRAVLKGEGVSTGALSIVFVGSRFIRSINRKYLAHDAVTDVIAFSLGERREAQGEIYVNLDRAATQARQYGVSAANETRRLIIHGLLHLLGYDDRTAHQKRTMSIREDRYLARR
jgi:probable rRNA maturation factor